MGKSCKGTEKQDKPRTHRDEVLSRLAPAVRKEMEELFQHENRILKALRDPVQAERFKRDPARVLASLGIELGPILRRRLSRMSAAAVAQAEQQEFRLPNGKTIRPKVKIRFTAGKDDDHAR